MTRVWSDAEKLELSRDAARFIPTELLIREWYGEANSPYPLDRLQQVYCRSWLVEDLLMKADKMSMANSLELRCPFLDHVLVEWSAVLPREWKVGAAGIGYSSKRILREFARPRLPTAIIDRPKRGFPVPAYGWLEGTLGAWAEDRLLRHGGLDRWFDVASLRPVLAQAMGGVLAAQHKIWSMLILDFWLEAWA
jgi:asparagine synthase (glutamine-hydrolysing)